MYKKILAITFAVMFLSSVLSVGNTMTPAFADNPNNDNSNFPQIAGNVTDNKFPLDFGINEKTNKIYIEDNNDVSVMDGNTDKITDVIPFGTSSPFGIIIDESKNIIYVDNTTNYQTSSLTVIDGKTDKIAKSISLGSGDAFNMVLDHNTNKLYASFYKGPVDIIDANTLNVIGTLPTIDNAYEVAINEKTDRIYAGEFADDTLTSFDGKTDQVIDAIQLGPPDLPNDCYKTNTCTTFGLNPHGISVNQETNTIYVSTENNGTFITIDGNTDQVTNSIQLVKNELYNNVVDEKTNTVYVLDPYQGLVFVIDDKTNEIVDIIPMGTIPLPLTCTDKSRATGCIIGNHYQFSSPQSIGINEKTDKVYVGVEYNLLSFLRGKTNNSGDIIVLDTNTHQMIDKMQMPMPPQPPNNNPPQPPNNNPPPHM